jgi:hypothetical protein
VAGLLVGTALLTGCSEPTEANDTLPSTSSASTTEALPEVGPADFPVPDEARTKDAAGAEAFLRYYIDLINQQRQIPTGQALRDLGPECQGCLRIARNYDEAAEAGIRYQGGQLSLNDVTTPRLEGNKASMSFGIRQEAAQRLDSSGALIDTGVPELPNVISGATLTYSEDDGTWLVEALDLG